MTPEDEALWQRFANGEIGRDEFMELLSQGPQDDQIQTGTTDPYGDDVSGDFAEFDHEGDEDEFEECMDYRLGEDAAPGAPAPADPQVDAQYMNGYNIGKRGGQAVAQNINTPQGAAYNSGFADAKAGKPPVAPSKRQNEAASVPGYSAWFLANQKKKDAAAAGRKNTKDAQAAKFGKKPVKEGVETFAAFLSKIDKPNEGVTKVSDIFKAKKKVKTPEAGVADQVVQDPNTTAIKIVNPPSTIGKSTNSW
jgi:hypothetical protein